MRVLPIAAIAFLLCASTARAQPPQVQATPPVQKLFASAGDLTAMIEKARKERKPDQPNYSQPILQLAPFRANLEYRASGVNANASVHERSAELIYVVQGAGTMVTGGTLREERRTNPENLSGTGVDGGTRQRVAQGDYIMVPENIPHWFGEIDDALVLMTLHLPRGSSSR